MPHKALAQKLIEQLETTAAALVRYYGLRYNQEFSSLSSPLIRWLDFRLRYVDPSPRQVCLSKAFPKSLPDNIQKALVNFTLLNLKGKDINPFQGTGLIYNNDTSSNQSHKRTDHLWADWGIHHFHLSERQTSEKFFSPRSDWLAFCFIASNVTLVIDVRHHGEKGVFSNKELIETLAKSWPQVMERFELNGILGSNKTYLPKEIRKFRTSGIMTPLTINGKVYMPPGLGVTSAATPALVTDMEMRLSHAIKELAKFLVQDDGVLRREVERLGGKISELDFTLTRKGLVLYSPTVDQAWLPSGNGEFNFIREIMAPSWAIEHVRYRVDNLARVWSW